MKNIAKTDENNFYFDGMYLSEKNSASPFFRKTIAKTTGVAKFIDRCKNSLFKVRFFLYTVHMANLPNASIFVMICHHRSKIMKNIAFSAAPFFRSLSADDALQFYAVFDGMGGEEYGETAALIAAQTLAKYHALLRAIHRHDFDKYMDMFLSEANNRICKAVAAIMSASSFLNKNSRFAALVIPGRTVPESKEMWIPR
jgi:hypothetical protein